MGCSVWCNSVPVSPQLFVLFTALVSLACFLAVPLIYLLLVSQDKDMRQAQLQAQEDFDGWHMIKYRWSIWPLVWIVFFVGLFAVGMRHY